MFIHPTDILWAPAAVAGGVPWGVGARCSLTRALASQSLQARLMHRTEKEQVPLLGLRGPKRASSGRKQGLRKSRNILDQQEAGRSSKEQKV